MTETMLLPGITLFAAFLFKQQQGFKLRNQQKEHLTTGLKLLSYSQKLIELVQQHRGLSNAMYLSGDSFDRQLEAVQGQMDALFNQPISRELQQFEQWQSFQDHWPRLRHATTTKKLTAAQSMRQHSAVIETQIYLLDEMAHFYQLEKIKLDRMSHMLGLCIDTLRTAEFIAKARGIGSGLCGAHSEHTADVISLNFIKQNLTVSSDQLFKDLLFVNNQDLSAYFEQSSQMISQSTKKLVTVIDDKVLSPTEAVDTQEFFKLATVPISQLLEVYNTIIKYVAKQYDVKV